MRTTPTLAMLTAATLLVSGCQSDDTSTDTPEATEQAAGATEEPSPEPSLEPSPEPSPEAPPVAVTVDDLAGWEQDADEIGQQIREGMLEVYGLATEDLDDETYRLESKNSDGEWISGGHTIVRTSTEEFLGLWDQFSEISRQEIPDDIPSPVGGFVSIEAVDHVGADLDEGTEMVYYAVVGVDVFDSAEDRRAYHDHDWPEEEQGVETDEVDDESRLLDDPRIDDQEMSTGDTTEDYTSQGFVVPDGSVERVTYGASAGNLRVVVHIDAGSNSEEAAKAAISEILDLAEAG